LKAIFLFSFLFFCGVEIYAQSDIEIKGTILNQNKRPVIGANVKLSADAYFIAVTTDSSGVYSIKTPKANYSVAVSNAGYVSQYLNSFFSKNTLLDFTLKQDSGVLKEVVILSESKKGLSVASSGKLSFIPGKLASVPSIMGTTDIIKLLQLTPGVQNSGDANGYLYVRGGDPGHNLLLYGSVPIYGMSHLAGIFPFYNANHIQEVQFDKSNLDAKHGGRLSSTVFVSPFKQVPKEFSVQGNAGLLSSQVTLSVPVNNRSGLYVSGRKTYVDELTSLFSDPKKENKEEQDLKYGFSDLNLTYISKITEKQLFTIDAFISNDKLDVIDRKSSFNSNLKWGNFAVSSDWSYQLSEETTLKNSIYFTRYYNKLDLLQGAVQMKISSYIQDIGYTNSIRYFVKKIPFETGFEYVLHDMQPQKIVISNLGIDDIDKQAQTIKSNNLAVFTSAKPKLWDNVFAELGLRLNYYTSGFRNSTYLHLEPRMAFTYSSKKDFSFYVSYTRQNQYLNLITASSVGLPVDFWIASSDGIPSQSSNEFSVGYNQNIKKQFKSSLSGYYRKMNNLIEYPYGVTQFNEITTLKNDILIGNGESYGLEWMLKKDSGKFKGWLSYTLSWSTRQFDELNNGNVYFAKFDRRHNISLVGTFDFNAKWSFGLTQIFNSGNRFTMPTSWYFMNNIPVKEYNEYNNAQLPNYIRTDVSVNYFFIKKVKKESVLNFSIFNTFNVENPIYVAMNVFADKDHNNDLTLHTDKKILYRILPSISWRFKF
jgi:hypothetical protein